MEERSLSDEFINQVHIAISNLILIADALPSSIYIAIEIIRFINKRSLKQDLTIPTEENLSFFNKVTGTRKKNLVMALESSVLDNLG